MASDETSVLLRAISPLIKGSGILLDVGAGTGAITRGLAQDRSIIAIEASPENAAELRKNIRGDDHAVICDRIENIELDKASVDSVVCTHALYYLSDLTYTLKRIFTWLRHGGIAVFVVLGERGDQSAVIRRYWRRYHPGQNGPRPSSAELITILRRLSREVRLQRVFSYCDVYTLADKRNFLSFALDVPVFKLDPSLSAELQKRLARERPYSRRGKLSTAHDIVVAWL
jgi:SAM-dependent methyltransferase